MELSYTNIRKALHRGRASLLLQINLPRLDSLKSFAVAEEIVNTYVKAAEALEKWAINVWLPQSEAELLALSRAKRLHYQPSVMQYTCQCRVINDQWLSVTNRVQMSGDEKIAYRDDRVWDLQSGRLCPVELFLDRKTAARYLRWTFSIDEGKLWCIPRAAKKQRSIVEPICVGKVKYLSFSY